MRNDRRGERGQILILTAFSMVVLLGMAALSIDASYMYDKRNQLYAAADAAAKLGATEVFRNAGVTQAALEAFAADQVIRHGFTPAACGTTTAGQAAICVNHPPTVSVPFAGNPGYVEVLISETTNTFFGRIIGIFSANPGARAVAGTGPGANCIVILGSDPSAITIGNGTTLDMPGCGIADGGGLDLKPGSVINADSVSVAVGPCYGVPNCTTGGPAPVDPLALLPPPSPAPAHTCTAPVTVDTNITVDVSNADQYYCGMSINNAVVTFNPGIYYIAGPITARNGGASPTLNGSGVMFFLAGPSGQFDLGLSNFVTLNLSAPTSGTYKAILFYQERGNTNAANISKNNGDNVNLSGAMYFPDAALTMKNGNGVTNDCALIVAKSADIKNNTTLSNGCAAYGGSPILAVSVSE